MNSKPLPGASAAVVQAVVQSGEAIADGQGVPTLFLKAINDRWVKQGGGAVFAVTLSHRSGANWRALGSSLIEYLNWSGGYVGVSMDGLFPAKAVSTWLLSAERSDGLCNSRLDWTVTPHPTTGKPTILNATWHVLQESAGSNLHQSLWDNIDSGVFDYGCDLLVTLYPAGAVPTETWRRPLTRGTFLRTLSRSTSWLVPLDGNLGFIVGVAAEANRDLHAFAAREMLPVAAS